MNEEWERWRGSMEARMNTAEARQGKTDEKLDRILREVTGIKVQVAGLVAVIVVAAELARWALDQFGG